MGANHDVRAVHATILILAKVWEIARHSGHGCRNPASKDGKLRVTASLSVCVFRGPCFFIHEKTKKGLMLIKRSEVTVDLEPMQQMTLGP